MIKFFRHIRRSLIQENKMGKYFKYAIGEIILVVIGILIALQINNWNEKRKSKERLNSIYESVLADIENDLIDLKEAKRFFMDKKPVFEKVLKDSVTPALLDQGLTRLLASGWKTTLNKSGVNQLKDIPVKDSLALKIIDIYELFEVELIDREQNFNVEVKEHSKYVRDNYDWYSEWIGKTIMKDNSSVNLQDYFVNGNDYRNKVIYGYQLLYNDANYIPTINKYIDYLTTLKLEIKEVLYSAYD